MEQTFDWIPGSFLAGPNGGAGTGPTFRQALTAGLLYLGFCEELQQNVQSDRGPAGRFAATDATAGWIGYIVGMTLGEALLRLGAASLIGGAIGLNRDLRGKPAGVRTHALVGIGSAVATLVGSSAFGEAVDPAAASRVIQGIITGIGFLGAGVILHRDGSQSVRGLTTAASIWVVAALGVACGTAQWPTAIVGTALTLIVLLLGGPFERLVRRFRGDRNAGSTLRSSRPSD